MQFSDKLYLKGMPKPSNQGIDAKSDAYGVSIPPSSPLILGGQRPQRQEGRDRFVHRRTRDPPGPGPASPRLQGPLGHSTLLRRVTCRMSRHYRRVSFRRVPQASQAGL